MKLAVLPAALSTNKVSTESKNAVELASTWVTLMVLLTAPNPLISNVATLSEPVWFIELELTFTTALFMPFAVDRFNQVGLPEIDQLISEVTLKLPEPFALEGSVMLEGLITIVPLVPA